MRKKLMILILLGVLFIGLSSVYALELSVTIKNVSDDSTDFSGKVSWSGIVPGQTKWQAADKYLFIEYSFGEELWPDMWGIQIFTDNTLVSRNTKYVYNANYMLAPAGVPEEIAEEIKGKVAGDFAAGLVHETGKHRLPMCWRAAHPVPFEDKETELKIIETAEHHLKRAGPEDYYCWIWMKDRANDGWSDPVEFWGQWFPHPGLSWQNGMDYATVVGPMGMQHAEMTFGGGLGAVDGQGNGPYGMYVYLGADFSEVAGGDYDTKVYVQMYHY